MDPNPQRGPADRRGLVWLVFSNKTVALSRMLRCSDRAESGCPVLVPSPKLQCAKSAHVKRRRGARGGASRKMRGDTYYKQVRELWGTSRRPERRAATQRSSPSRLAVKPQSSPPPCPSSALALQYEKLHPNFMPAQHRTTTAATIPAIAAAA